MLVGEIPKTTKVMLVLEGDVEEFGANALIRLISGSQRTGRLEFQTAASRSELRFSGGDVCGAYSSNADDLLGVRLVRAGVVTGRRIRAALDEHVDLECRLGEVLIDSGDIDRELLSWALHEQMLDRILDILEWETGTFTWTPAEEIRLDEAVAITPQEIFDEHLRRGRYEEWSRQVMVSASQSSDRNSKESPASAKTPAVALTSTGALDDIFDVVVVCTGNQFRSPIVEGLMRASSSDLPVRVSSVGTKEVGAAPALPEAVRLGSEFGVDLTGHRARSLRGIDLSGADLVLGFEVEHVAAAVIEAGANETRTFTILELISLLEGIIPPEDEDLVKRARAAVESAHRMRSKAAPIPPGAQIPDPVGGRPVVYRRTADHLRTATRQLIDRLFGFVPYSPPPPG